MRHGGSFGLKEQQTEVQNFDAKDFEI